jgi:hypothetical protein
LSFSSHVILSSFTILLLLLLPVTSFPFLQGLLARVFGLLPVDLSVHHGIDLFSLFINYFLVYNIP